MGDDWDRRYKELFGGGFGFGDPSFFHLKRSCLEECMEGILERDEVDDSTVRFGKNVKGLET